MAAPEGGHGRQEHVLLFFQTPQHQADAGTDAEQKPPGHEQGIVGRAAHVRGRDQPHVGGQGPQPGEQVMRDVGRIAAEHERDEGVPDGPAEAQQAGGQQPAANGGQGKAGKDGMPAHAQGKGGQEQAAHLFAQGHIHDQHHGGADEQGQDTGGGEPAQAGALTGGLPDQGREQEHGGKAVDHRGDGGHEADEAREPFLPERRGGVLQGAGQPQGQGPGQQQGGKGQDEGARQHGQDAEVRGGTPRPGEDQAALGAPEHRQGKAAHQGEQGACGKDDEQAAQTGQDPAAPQERKCHVQDPGGAAWPPRIVW